MSLGLPSVSATRGKGYCEVCDRESVPLAEIRAALRCTDCIALTTEHKALDPANRRLSLGDYVLLLLPPHAPPVAQVWSPQPPRRFGGNHVQRMGPSKDNVTELLRSLVRSPPDVPFMAFAFAARTDLRETTINSPGADLIRLSGPGDWGIIPAGSVLNRRRVLGLLRDYPQFGGGDWSRLMALRSFGDAASGVEERPLLRALSTRLPHRDTPDAWMLRLMAPKGTFCKPSTPKPVRLVANPAAKRASAPRRKAGVNAGAKAA